MSEEKRSKRQIIIDTINEGGATLDSLAKAAECKYASVMSNFSMLRLMGMFPVKDVAIVETVNEVDEDGVETGETKEVETLTYRFVDAEEKAKLDAEAAERSTTKREPKDPKKRYDAAVKRVDRCTKASETATKKADKDEDNRELGLRAEKAAIELELAKIELDKAKEVFPDWGVEVEVDEALEASGTADETDFED